MSSPDSKRGSGDRTRRYVLHHSGARQENGEWHYIGHIRPWTAPSKAVGKTQEHDFGNECDLIEAVNPLLPHGSDVRDVLSHIESRDGFFYLLHLTVEQAAKFGWAG